MSRKRDNRLLLPFLFNFFGTRYRNKSSYQFLFCLNDCTVSHNKVVELSKPRRPMDPNDFATSSPCAADPPASCSISLKAVTNVHDVSYCKGVEHGQVFNEVVGYNY